MLLHLDEQSIGRTVIIGTLRVKSFKMGKMKDHYARNSKINLNGELVTGAFYELCPLMYFIPDAHGRCGIAVVVDIAGRRTSRSPASGGNNT